MPNSASRRQLTGPAEPCCDRPCEKAGEPKDYIVGMKGKAHEVYLRTPKIDVTDLIHSLETLPKSEFTSEKIADFLQRHPVDLESLKRFTFFDKNLYTRNRIAINDRYEVMMICWGVGHATPIHNHEGQNCWVNILSGKLSFTNFKWLGCDREKRTVHLEEFSRVPMAAEGSLNVIDERDAIHRLGNDSTFGERAISLHVYAKPLTTCVIYDNKAQACWDQSLTYYSIDGARCA